MNNKVEDKQKIKVFIKKLQDENEELEGNTSWLKLQDEKLHDLRHKAKIWETTKRKWTKTLLFHKQQQKALGSQVKEFTKEKKEKENVLTYLELVSLKNAYLLQFEKLKRKIAQA